MITNPCCANYGSSHFGKLNFYPILQNVLICKAGKPTACSCSVLAHTAVALHQFCTSLSKNILHPKACLYVERKRCEERGKVKGETRIAFLFHSWRRDQVQRNTTEPFLCTFLYISFGERWLQDTEKGRCLWL